MRRALRSILVGMLVLAMGVDPATACHFLRGRWGGGGWEASNCPAPVEYAGPCNGVIIDGDGCCSYQGYVHEVAIVEDDCCCEGATVAEHEGVIKGESHPAPEPPAQPEPAPAETFKPAEVELAPALPPDPMPSQPVEPADDELLTPPAPTATPAEPAPAPAVTTPATPTPPPATENDLFGTTTEPPASTAPAETSAAPSAEPMDDFFSEGPAHPAEAAPAVESAPAPATTPAPAVTPPAPTETPVTPPADTTEATPGAEDLFGETPAATTEAPAETAPPAEPPSEAPADENVEDLGMDALDASEQPATPADDGAPSVPETPPATEEPATEEPATETDDLFDFGAILREPGGLSSSEMRRWVDNTGRYSCNARLLRFVDGQVRLLKENGRTSTLPLYRLSENDLQFVHRQASAEQAQVIGQTVQSMSVVTSLAY